MGGWGWGPGEIRQTPQPGLQVSQKKQESCSPHYGSSHLSPLTLLQHCQETPPRPHSSLPFVSGLTLAISADSARSQGLGSSWWAGNYGAPPETQHPSTPQLSRSTRSSIYLTLQASLPVLVPALPPRRRNGYRNQVDPRLPLDLGLGALTASLSLQWP